MNSIQPIETKYKGYRFRSRLEARWAVFFDALGVEYEYEPEGFKLPNGKVYLPDFRLKCWGCRGSHSLETPFDLYVEVKGVMTLEDAQKIWAFSNLDTWNDLCVPLVCGDCDGGSCPRGFHKSGYAFEYPVLILGNIPAPAFEKLVHDADFLKSYEYMNGIGIFQFNYQTIDGDHFGAFPAATSDGKFYLWGDDCNYINYEDVERVFLAYGEALSARFEHGESPNTNKNKPDFYGSTWQPFPGL